MTLLLTITLLPILIILGYIYFKDKEEKEPIKFLINALLLGAGITVPVWIYGQLLEYLLVNVDYGTYYSLVISFLFAAIPEELFKFIAVLYLIWKSPYFNEKFDGIVYAVFVSLGFAATENIIYVFGADNGMNVAIIRAFTAVPAHATFGIAMGYFLSVAKYFADNKNIYLSLSLFVAIILHGIYDLILFSQTFPLIGNNEWEYVFWNLLFIPFCIFLWVQGFKKIKKLS